jgi:hypothetical protein
MPSIRNPIRNDMTPRLRNSYKEPRSFSSVAAMAHRGYKVARTSSMYVAVIADHGYSAPEMFSPTKTMKKPEESVTLIFP